MLHQYGMESEVSTYGDVYSYGILLFKMFTGKRPTDEMFNDNLTLHNFVKIAFSDGVERIANPMLLKQGEGKQEKLPRALITIGVMLKFWRLWLRFFELEFLVL